VRGGATPWFSSLGQALLLLLVKELEEKKPGQVLGVLHHPAHVVVAAQDVARARCRCGAFRWFDV
jgi:hypothetical protein